MRPEEIKEVAVPASGNYRIELAVESADCNGKTHSIEWKCLELRFS